MTLPPYPRPSPPPEVKPIVDDRLASPSAPHPYGSHHQQPPGSITSGVPATTTSEVVQRERDDKVPETRVKRLRSWEDDDGGASVKKPASDDAKARLEEIHHRPSPPRPGARLGSPVRRGSSERSRNDDYHQGPPPQHQHQTLPPISSSMSNNHQLAPISEGSRHEPPRRPDEDRVMKEVIEPAARKVNVDENYDDVDEEDVKRSGKNGHPSSASQEKKTSPSGTNAGNGVPAGPANDP